MQLPEKKTIKTPAAGVVVLKQYANVPYGYRVLCLVDDKGFDLPKGQVEPFETNLVAALRECEEESGVSQLDFRWGLVTTQCNNVTLYIAETTEEPNIRPNPETGEFEHYSAHWLDLDRASKSLRGYLRPSIDWVYEVIGV
jgi:8-oxo-dGTP pyrophosphatase MutT (NUDIX family)